MMNDNENDAEIYCNLVILIIYKTARHPRRVWVPGEDDITARNNTLDGVISTAAFARSLAQHSMVTRKSKFAKEFNSKEDADEDHGENDTKVLKFRNLSYFFIYKFKLSEQKGKRK